MDAKKFNAKKAWLVVVVGILVQVGFAISLMKVPSNMVLIMNGMGIDPVLAGNLMTVNGIVALIISLPAGMIMQKKGPRFVLLFALAVGLIGNIIGATIGATNYAALLVSRCFEGFGYGLMLVAVPQFIYEWFPSEKSGLPLGIQSAWFAYGSLIMLNAAAFLPGAAEGSWLGSWWFSIVFFVIVGVAAFFVCKSPCGDEMQLDVEAGEEGKPKASLIDGLKAPGTWLILIMFFMFSFLTSSFAGFFPTYLQQDLGMDMVSANFVTSVATIANIVAGIVGGFLLNRVAPSKRPVCLFVVTVLIGACGIAMYNMPGIAMVIPFCVVYGLISQLFPPTAYAIAPETAYSPDTVSGTLGVITFGSNLAGACGTFITSVVMTAFGNSWQAATIPNALFAALAVVAGITLLFYMKKRNQKA